MNADRGFDLVFLIVAGPVFAWATLYLFVLA